MLKVGLTGGIGCGKSTVCEIFRQLGVPVIDTDELARQVVTPSSSVLGEITEIFGRKIINADGSLNRNKLREMVFSDAAKRRQLEAVIHPAIRSLLHKKLSALDSAYVIIAIPLLIEKSWQAQVDRILVVDCSEELQLARAMARDGSDEQLIQAIINSQVSRKNRLEEADDIIHNDADLNSLQMQVEDLHKYYTHPISDV